MEFQQKGFATLEVISESSKSIFGRSSGYIHIPGILYSDSQLPTSSLPNTIQWHTISSLIFISSEGTKLIELAYQESQAIKCFDDTGESVYFIYFSNEPSLQTFVLAKYELFELCPELNSYLSELHTLSLNRVKDIKFKSSIKDSLASYKSYFDQWVDTVNSQQKEIQKLSDELAQHKEKQENFNEPAPELISECVICLKEKRNVVFVPCGHVAVCTYCLNTSMKLTLNDINPQKKSQHKCVTCKRSIKVAHEVYF